jgi:hypothetical protein
MGRKLGTDNSGFCRAREALPVQDDALKGLATKLAALLQNSCFRGLSAAQRSTRGFLVLKRPLQKKIEKEDRRLTRSQHAGIENNDLDQINKTVDIEDCCMCYDSEKVFKTTGFATQLKDGKGKKGYLQLNAPITIRQKDITKIITRPYAHQVITLLFRGQPKTDTYEVRHLCNNKACLSPLHLLWGTAKENRKDHSDKIKRFRWTPSHDSLKKRTPRRKHFHGVPKCLGYR